MKTILAAFLLTVISSTSAQVPYLLLDGSDQTTPGKVGLGYHFDGKSPIPIARAPVVPPWTVCAWVRRLPGITGCSLFSDSDHALKIEQVNVGTQLGNVGLTVFFVKDHAFNYALPLNLWSHVIFKCDGKSTELWINGSYTDTLPLAFPLPLAVLGNRYGRPANIDGLHADLDEVAVYRHALSTNEVARIFANGGTNNLPSKISSIKANPGRVTLQISGTPKTSVLLESSPDLVRWTTSVPLENDGGLLTVIDIAPSSRIFYRISDEP